MVRIGTVHYELRLARGRLFFNRQECECRCDHDNREIVISDLVPQAQRLELVARAVNETWQRYLRGSRLVPFIGDVPSNDASDPRD